MLPKSDTVDTYLLTKLELRRVAGGIPGRLGTTACVLQRLASLVLVVAVILVMPLSAQKPLELSR